MKKISFLVVAGAILISTSGCANFVKRVYGFKPYRVLVKSEISELANTYHIPADKVFMIDTNYRSFLQSNRAEYTSFITENHNHPLQAIFYGRNGSPVSYHNGVYADAGLSNLRWNKGKPFNSFPPMNVSPLDSMMDFTKHLSFIRTLDNQKLDPAQFAGADYNVIVHWANFPGRQTKRIINIIQKNAKLNTHLKVNYIYVNTDNLYQGVQ